jgi:calcineurin-like phosphoesterase family protein
LGDVCFGSVTNAISVLQQLNGSKILIAGNHDHHNIKKPAFAECFTEIHTYLSIMYNNQKIVMFHFPIIEWDQVYRGSIHLYGHLHGTPVAMVHSRAMDVGMDATGNVVSELDEIVETLLKFPSPTARF